MGSVNLSSDEDGYDQHSYSLSADISESESSSSFSGRRFQPEPFSTSSTFAFRPLVGNCSFPAPPALLFPVIGGRDVVLLNDEARKPETDLSEVELMKEKFAKLLLGEDMSGGGKGVCTALAVSNSITNLAASVFGELWRLEPLASQRKKMWCREMDWLLSVSDSIVEFVPEMQEIRGVGTFEIMATRPRSDLYVNLPALKKLDAMLLGMLDGFKETEFWYIERGISVPENGARDLFQPSMVRQEDKWWLPCPKVPSNGLSVSERKRLQQCRDYINQILKAAFAINSNVLAEMDTPSAYLETLPKKGKEYLGDVIYRYLTDDQFSPECLLDCLDLSSEHHTLEVANRIEASVLVWRQKDQKRHINHSKSKRSKWGGKVKGLVTDHDKEQVLAQRAETLLRSLKLRFPGLPQTTLDMSKIQYNKDVGQAILESYSRVMESLAYNIMARIDDLLFVDDETKKSNCAESKSLISRGGFGSLPIQKRMSPIPFSNQHSPRTSPFATPNLCFSPIELEDLKLEKPDPIEFERIWSHPGNLSAAKAGDAPERD